MDLNRRSEENHSGVEESNFDKGAFGANRLRGESFQRSLLGMQPSEPEPTFVKTTSCFHIYEVASCSMRSLLTEGESSVHRCHAQFLNYASDIERIF